MRTTVSHVRGALGARPDLGASANRRLDGDTLGVVRSRGALEPRGRPIDVARGRERTLNVSRR